MSTVHSVLGKNLVDCRHRIGMTQLQVAEHLNYTDKAISKWERGESIPDISVLKQVATLYGVSIDYLLEEEHGVPFKDSSYLRQNVKNRKAITVISVLMVWLIAVILFLIFYYLDLWKPYYYFFFLYAVPLSFVVWLVFNSVWLHPRINYIIISCLMWALLICLVFSFYASGLKLFLIFLVGIPGQLIILTCSMIRRRNRSSKRGKRGRKPNKL